MVSRESENKAKSLEIRERLLPLPTAKDGYRSVLMIGTFGAGKTTTIRQLLGTNPKTERFPATNPGKTTVADAEYVLTNEEVYRAAVTFFDLRTIVQHLKENFIVAGKIAVANPSDFDVYRSLVDHHASRFRFSYLFGVPENMDEDLLGIPPSKDTNLRAKSLRDAPTELLQIVSQLRNLAIEIATHSESRAKADGYPDAEIQNFIEQQLDEMLSVEKEGSLLSEFLDLAIDLICDRIDAVESGSLEFDESGWPISWTVVANTRKSFLEELSLFASNDYRRFGELLFPLVNGVRVTGPFKPSWAGSEDIRLVIADSQGLEHASVGNVEAEDMDRYDIVAVVDNAVQPMQQAPWERLCHLASSGSAAKTRVLFSKFDQAGGDGLGTLRDRVRWIQANFNNPIERDREVYGPSVTRLLQKLATERTFYLGHLNEILDIGNREHEFTITQLKKFISSVFEEEPTLDEELPIPVISRRKIWEAVKRAGESFRTRWKGYLGVVSNNDYPKAHWATMKALTRRLGEGWAEEHGHLAPVAHFRSPLEREMFDVLAEPERWTVTGATDAAKDEAVQKLARLLQPTLREISQHRVSSSKRTSWFHAYSRMGNGSSYVRAQIVDNQVVNAAAPVAGTSDFDELVLDILIAMEGLAREGYCFLID